MNRSLCSRSLVSGFIGCMMLAGTAAAQPASSAGEGGRYSGTSGSQALQEQMYEARMKAMLGEPSQADQASKEMQGQKSMKGAEESSQKMQPDKGSDRMTGEERATDKR